MSIESESRRIFNESHSEVLRLRAENTQLRAELNEEAVLNGKGSEREAALLAKVERLERENAALREDKERLDWLLTDDGGFWVNWMYEKDEWTPKLKASRDGIDAAKRRGHE